MSLTCAVGDLKQHDTSLAKVEMWHLCGTPLSDAGKPKPLVPCMWPWAEPNLVVCRMRPGFGPLGSRLPGFKEAKTTVPQVRDLFQQDPQHRPNRARSYLWILFTYLLEFVWLDVKSPRPHKSQGCFRAECYRTKAKWLGSNHPLYG